MNKKFIILIIFIVIITMVTGVATAKILRQNKENMDNKNFDTKVVSTFTIDVNPSFEVSLNKNKEVVSVKSLNDDGNLLLGSKDYQGQKLENTIESLINDLRNSNYLNDESNTILINVNSNDKDLKSIIKDSIKKVTDEKKIATDLVLLEVKETKELKQLSEKYNISIAKAYYIEQNLKTSDNYDIKEYVENSIDEIKEKIDLINQDGSQSESNSQADIQPVSPPMTTGSCNPPSSATENKSAWCTFNRSRPQNCEFNYPEMIDDNDARAFANSYLGISFGDAISSYSTQRQDERSSYCIAKVVNVTTRQKKYNFIIDSVTKEIIEFTSEDVPSPTLSEMDAVNVVLNYYGLKYEDCRMCGATFSTNGEGSDNWYYRYNVGILMNDGTQHVADINPFNGSIISIIY